MHKLYDLGYLNIKDPDLLTRAIAALDAVLLDVRLNPLSRHPRWNKSILQEILGERYIHVFDLGNVNYRKGGPVLFRDLIVGLMYIGHYLEYNNVILMCACQDRQQCHRLAIAKEYDERFHVASIPLFRRDCEILVQNKQYHLF